MLANFIEGLGFLLQGFKLISQPGLRLFLLIPVTMNILLFGLLIVWASSMLGGWMDILMSWLPEWLAFMEWLFWTLYLVAILMAIFYSFVTVSNLLAAPFYGYLAELTEARLGHTQNEQAFTWKTLVALIPRTIGREIRKIMYFLPRLLGLFILGLIPGINALAAVLWIVFSAWMMAIQYLDYPADNHELSFQETLSYLREHRSAAFGFGFFTFFLTLLPLINLIAFPAAVCGAAAFWVNKKSQHQLALSRTRS